MKLIELQQRTAKLVADAQQIVKEARDEGRVMTSDERSQVNKMIDDSNELDKEIETVKALDERERSLNLRSDIRKVEPDPNTPDADKRTGEQVEGDSFRNWMRYGVVADNEAERAEFTKRSVSMGRLEKDLNIPDDMKRAIRAAQTISTTAGGYLIPRAFSNELDVALLAYGGMREAGRLVPTGTGAPLDWPTINDTAVKGRKLDINVVATNTALAYGTMVLDAYKYSSDSVLVPVELAQDSFFDIDGHVRDMLATRLGRITNQELTIGDGTDDPNGVVTAATDSSVNLSIAGLAAGTEWEKFVDLEHSVDPEYRKGARFMMHDDLLRDVKTQVDGNGRPIFRSALESPGGVMNLLGYPITINQDTPTPTSTNIACLFGDFSKYIIRVVRPMVMLRLVERWADAHQIGFLAFERLDGDLSDAGTNPIKYADMVA